MKVLGPVSGYFRHRHQLLVRRHHRCLGVDGFLAVESIHAVAGVSDVAHFIGHFFCHVNDGMAVRYLVRR